MTIPCGENDHWRFIGLYVFWPRDDFNADSFKERLGIQEGDRWIAQATEDPQCHTHGRLIAPPKPEGVDEEEEVRAWVIDLDTYRNTTKHEGAPLVTMETMLSAMAGAATAEECFVGATVDVGFPAERAEWRPSLLAQPPKFEDLKEDLGRIVLSGLTLRFEDSQQGLVEAALDISSSGKTYSTNLRFSQIVKTSELDQLYPTILSKAERFASLFIEHRGA